MAGDAITGRGAGFHPLHVTPGLGAFKVAIVHVPGRGTNNGAVWIVRQSAASGLSRRSCWWFAHAVPTPPPRAGSWRCRLPVRIVGPCPLAVQPGRRCNQTGGWSMPSPSPPFPSAGFSYSKGRKATRVCQKTAEIRRFNDFRPPFYLAFPEPDFGVPIRRYPGASPSVPMMMRHRPPGRLPLRA